MSELLFVYGTLKTDGYTHFAKQLRRNASFLLPVSLNNGVLYKIDWYPALHTCRKNQFPAVCGQLYQLKKGTQILIELDNYEGIAIAPEYCIDYVRKKMEVRFKRSKYQAWVYVFKERPFARKVIKSGKFNSGE